MPVYLRPAGQFTTTARDLAVFGAFLLQSHPYRETSLVVDVFSRDFGRIGLVARGAKRPRSQLRGVLVEFQPLDLGWFGAGELRTLARAEWQSPDYAEGLLCDTTGRVVEGVFSNLFMVRDQVLLTYPVSRDRLDVFTEVLTPAKVEPRVQRPVEMTAVILMLVGSNRGVAVLFGDGAAAVVVMF